MGWDDAIKHFPLIKSKKMLMYYVQNSGAILNKLKCT